MRNRIIRAIVTGAYRFDAKSDVIDLLGKIAKECLLSKDRPESNDHGFSVLKLWVQGYEVTADEKAKGYRGNFAFVTGVLLPSGQYSLQATKLDVPLDKHPQKDYPKGYHPNWGNPTMRAVEKGKIFSSMAEANAMLDQLHMDYPKATVPGTNSLSIMLYKRNDKGDSPIEKITVKVKPLEAGGAKLVLVKKKPKAKKPPAPKKPAPAAGSQGKFTDMVLKKRSRKKT